MAPPRGIKDIFGASRAPSAPGSPSNPQGTKTKNQIWKEHYEPARRSFSSLTHPESSIAQVRRGSEAFQ